MSAFIHRSVHYLSAALASSTGCHRKSFLFDVLCAACSFVQLSRYARVTHAREDWIRVLEVNINSFHAAAQYWQSKVDHDNAVKTRKDWGIECGRLAYAETLINRVCAVPMRLGLPLCAVILHLSPCLDVAHKKSSCLCLVHNWAIMSVAQLGHSTPFLHRRLA